MSSSYPKYLPFHNDDTRDYGQRTNFVLTQKISCLQRGWLTVVLVPH